MPVGFPPDSMDLPECFWLSGAKEKRRHPESLPYLVYLHSGHPIHVQGQKQHSDERARYYRGQSPKPVRYRRYHLVPAKASPEICE